MIIIKLKICSAWLKLRPMALTVFTPNYQAMTLDFPLMPSAKKLELKHNLKFSQFPEHSLMEWILCAVWGESNVMKSFALAFRDWGLILYNKTSSGPAKVSKETTQLEADKKKSFHFDLTVNILHWAEIENDVWTASLHIGLLSKHVLSKFLLLHLRKIQKEYIQGTII